MSRFEERALQPAVALTPVTPIPKSMSIRLAESEHEMQIVTARKYPREASRVRNAMIELAQLDREGSADMLYSLPRRNADGNTSQIEGPSIRFAETLAQAWGNCRISARVVEVNRIEKWVEAEGIFLDLQTNMATSARIRRRISNSKGKLYSDDMIQVTSNAACSIARRNAILGGIPKPVYRAGYEAAKRVVAGSLKDLPEIRQETVKVFGALGVKPQALLAAIGLKSLSEVTQNDIVTLRGMYASIMNEEATIEEIFGTDQGVKKLEKMAAKEPEPEPATAKAKPIETLDDVAERFEEEEDPAVTAAEKCDEAYNKGREAYYAGHSSKKVPEPYKSDPNQTQAWLKGFADGREEDSADD